MRVIWLEHTLNERPVSCDAPICELGIGIQMNCKMYLPFYSIDVVQKSSSMYPCYVVGIEA